MRVTNPEKGIPENPKSRLLEQLQRLLVLIIDERSMISSKVLAAAERNTRVCIYRSQNSSEIWGGLPVVLLFGDDYQLMPVDKNGAINRIQGKSMLENKKLSDREIMYQFLRRIPIQNRTIAHDIMNRDSNEKQVFKAGDNNVM